MQKKLNKNKQVRKHLQSSADSEDKTSSSGRFLRHIFITVFPKHFCITLNFEMSRSICKLRRKVRNGLNLPHESANFTYYLLLGHISTSLRPHYQNIFFLKYFFLSKLQDV